MPIPIDYVERVYAGVLGKIIGVYLGRPFEGWSHERILAELGEVNYYVAEKLGVPLVVTDDDISGTFTFIRALEDYGCTRDITPEQIGRTWMNYIIENKTILWWGGLGMSTEHTAFLRMKHGIPAPGSGSVELNGKIVAEQIGSQIFIDGWAMIAPGDPALATDLARKAASVSHDGEAIYAAQVVAAIESMAFVENDINKLIDFALTFIPKDCLIAKMIADLLRWRQNEPDWRKALKLLAADYGYDKYGGNCHVIPNHGVIILSLLWGEDSFQRSLMIANTCGWDTDCNSGNVGCIMGIKNGLTAINAGPDWRGPVADRIYLPTADGGRCITDAVTETYRIARMGKQLARNTGILPVPSSAGHGQDARATEKLGARFHFSLPGSLQGFQIDSEEASAASNPAVRIRISNGEISVGPETANALIIDYRHLMPGHPARAKVFTFIPPDAHQMPGYTMVASPTLYPGQLIRARVMNLPRPIDEEEDSELHLSKIQMVCRPYLLVYGEGDQLMRVPGPGMLLQERRTAGGGRDPWNLLEWRVPETNGQSIAAVGLEFSTDRPTHGSACVDYLTWSGLPDCTFKRPPTGGTMWQRAWVDSGQSLWWGQEPFRLISNDGRATLSTGTDGWTDYRVSTTIEANLAKSFGIAVRVRGLHRFYSLLLDTDGTAKLVKSLDGDKILAQCPFPWELNQKYNFSLQAVGPRLTAYINDRLLFDTTDNERPFLAGGIALVCEDGRIDAGAISVKLAFCI